MLTAVLYLLIFGHVLEDHVKVFDGVGYTSFLIPGLVMMSVLQNAFANSSSSLIQSKITGNLVFLLVTPLSHWAWFVGLRRRVGGARPGGGRGRVRWSPCGSRRRRWPSRWWIVVFALLGAAHDGRARADRRACGPRSSTRSRRSRTSSSCR